jgi:hypothetical protein
MQFHSMKPLAEGFPIIEVGDHEQLDLHNDGDLREFSCEWKEKTLRVTWTMKYPAWKAPAAAAEGERKTVASATLLFSGLREVRIEGQLVGPSQGGDEGLDFLEYRRDGNGIGEVRIVLLNGSAIVVRASRCELRTTTG